MHAGKGINFALEKCKGSELWPEIGILIWSVLEGQVLDGDSTNAITVSIIITMLFVDSQDC